LLRGSIYYNDRQLDRAVEDLHAAVRLQPDNPLGYQLLAEALLHKGDTKEALKMIDQALSKGSSFAGAFVTRGDIHLADSHIDRAVEAYSHALNIDPNDFQARIKRAKLYIELSKWDLGLADLEEAAKSNPYSGEAYALRSRCHEALGDAEKARADAWKAQVFANR
jgi:tetratricopeptide (TPR) repeat protein